MATESQVVIVKDSVVGCTSTTRCSNNHAPHHTKFGGRVGSIEGDLKHILKVHPESLDWDLNSPAKCIECGQLGSPTLRERIYTHNHYVMVCFAGKGDGHATQEESDQLHGIFSPDELDDFDTNGVLNLVVKETLVTT